VSVKLNERLFVALLVTACAALPIEAQSGRMRTGPGASKKQDERKQYDKETLRLRAEEVLLPISVRSDNGKLPTYLERSDFIVTEDGKRQQVNTVIRAPANILLILDASGEVNMRKDGNLNREIAYKIIDSLGKDDRAAIITYSDKITLLAPWTSDKQELRRSLEWNYKPGLQSRFYGTLVYAAEEVLPKVTGRRSVVLMTDGYDSFNNGLFEKALAAFHKARATVYVFSHSARLIADLKPRVMHKLAWYEMLDPATRKRYEPLRAYVRQLEATELLLKGLAEETGGAIWNPTSRIDCKPKKSALVEPPKERKDLEPSLDCQSLSNLIIEEIGTEYVISYSSERAADDAKFHAVKVFSTRPEIKVRTRRGIYSNSRTQPSGAASSRFANGRNVVRRS
jgi:VWFA-related protein